MDILEKNNIYGSKYWINSENKNFSEIVEDNFQLPKRWSLSHISFSDKYFNKILKPINGYSEKFSIKPELIEDNNKNFLRYYTHAEIWVEEKENGVYALDKCWQTQFYPSNLKYETPINCYKPVYKFYCPWLIDLNKNFKIFSIKESPFIILNDNIKFNNLIKTKIIDSPWIHFCIKNIGDHIEYYENQKYSILDIKTPICDILIEDNTLIERIKNER